MKLASETLLADTLPSLREVIRSSELWAKRSLGQNFLLDLNLTRKIVKAAGSLKNITVIEIGPGPGGLTRALLETDVQQVIALEKDPRALKALSSLKELYQDRLILMEGDALEVDLHHLGASPRYVIANLPYNIATPLLMHCLDHVSCFHKFILMFQKEVADRILAFPKTKAYGRLSIKTQWLCKVNGILTLPPQAFFPPPKVYSTVVELIPYAKPLYMAPVSSLDLILQTAFSKRRKMMRSSLNTLSIDLNAFFEKTNILPTSRPEDLSIQDFCRMAQTYAELTSS